MTPCSFMCVTEMFVSHGSTPAVWPKGGTLSSAGGPCLSGASWSALLRPASVRSNAASRGVTLHGAFRRVRPLLGPFAETKGPRLPGRNPATQKVTLTRELGTQVRCVHLPTFFYWQNPRWILDKHRRFSSASY